MVINIAAHELRNPMTPIVGVAELALIAARKAKASVRRASSPCWSACSVSFRTMLGGQRSCWMSPGLSPVTCNWSRPRPTCSQLVLSIVHRYEAEAAHQHCALEHDIEADVSGRFDPLAVEQIIENLVSNAVKFGAGKPVTLRLRSDGRSALLEVQDRGIGMSIDQQERIFGRFEQIVARHEAAASALACGSPAVWSRPWMAGSPYRAARARDQPSPSCCLWPPEQDQSTHDEHEADAAAEERDRAGSKPCTGPRPGPLRRFPERRVYMIQGPPGSGKTVLANQIIYRHAAEGSRALFITVLGENHGRMMAHLRPMRFFDQSLIPDRVTYLSAYQALEDEGLEGLTTLIRREVLATRRRCSCSTACARSRPRPGPGSR